MKDTAILPRVEVRPSLSFGWLWRIDGHEHTYGCADALGTVACDDGGWRPTRGWAVAAGARAVRRKDRLTQRARRGWESPTNGSPADHREDDRG